MHPRGLLLSKLFVIFTAHWFHYVWYIQYVYVPVALKDQQSPHWPWFFTGVTAPFETQSRLSGYPLSFSREDCLCTRPGTISGWEGGTPSWTQLANSSWVRCVKRVIPIFDSRTKPCGREKVGYEYNNQCSRMRVSNLVTFTDCETSALWDSMVSRFKPKILFWGVN